MTNSLLKKLAIFAGLLVILWGVYLVRQVPTQQTPFAKTLDAATRLSIQRGSQKVELSRDSTYWQVHLSSTQNAPADEPQVTALLSSLKNVTVGEQISDRPDRIGDFEVDESSGVRVTLWDVQGKPIADGIFGKQAADFLHIFYRTPDSAKVFLARGIYRGELGMTDPLAWRSRQLVDIPETDIKRFTVERGGKQIEYVRLSTDTWSSKGRAVNVDQVNRMVGTLAHLRADSFLNPTDEPISFEKLTYGRILIQGENVTAELRIGTGDKKNPRHPVSTGKDKGIAWLSESTVNSLLP